MKNNNILLKTIGILALSGVLFSGKLLVKDTIDNSKTDREKIIEHENKIRELTGEELEKELEREKERRIKEEQKNIKSLMKGLYYESDDTEFETDLIGDGYEKDIDIYIPIRDKRSYMNIDNDDEISYDKLIKDTVDKIKLDMVKLMKNLQDGDRDNKSLRAHFTAHYIDQNDKVEEITTVIFSINRENIKEVDLDSISTDEAINLGTIYVLADEFYGMFD